MTRVVLCMLDGMRADQAADLPHVARLRREGTWCGAHAAIFPSATRASSASVATGCFPARHGLHGNQMALADDDGYRVHDVGKPEFFDLWRAATGQTLRQPTLAERLASTGGAIVFSNVSPGAALAHDPDGHGYVYHRAVNQGPGRTPLPDPLDVTLSLEGDRAAAERFCNEILLERAPRLAVLWLGNPDDTQHDHPLGSPVCRAALASADALLGLVADTVDRLNEKGGDILLLAGSDHGHETVRGTVAVENEIISAGFKRDAEDPSLVVAPQGTGFLVYARPEARGRVSALSEWLSTREWCGRVVAQAELPAIGHADQGGLVLAVGMAADVAVNAHGVPGHSLIATRFGGPVRSLGNGSHGGFGRYETAPFLLARGRGFAAGGVIGAPSSLVDIAPTVLTHLDLMADGLDGRPLQTAHHPPPPKAAA